MLQPAFQETLSVAVVSPDPLVRRAVLIPIPVLGLVFGIHPHRRVGLEFELFGNYIPEIQGVQGYLGEATVTAKVYVIENLSVGLKFGAVMLHTEIDQDTDGDISKVKADLDYMTWQIGGVVGFSF